MNDSPGPSACVPADRCELDPEVLCRLDAFCSTSQDPADEFDEFPLDVQDWELVELRNGQAGA